MSLLAEPLLENRHLNRNCKAEIGKGFYKVFTVSHCNCLMECFTSPTGVDPFNFT
jgi:hypothetical protein